MKNILFAFGLGSAVGTVVFAVSKAAKGFGEWWVDRQEKKRNP